MDAGLMTTDEAAKYLGLSAGALEIWRQRGTGPTYRKLGEGTNSPVRYQKEDLDAWVKAHTVKPANTK